MNTCLVIMLLARLMVTRSTCKATGQVAQQETFEIEGVIPDNTCSEATRANQFQLWFDTFSYSRAKQDKDRC